MSLILDALNRSRNNAGDIPGLEARHTGAEKRGSAPAILSGLALGLTLVLIAVLIWDRADRAGRAAPGAASVIPRQSPPQAMAPALPPEPVQTTVTETAAASVSAASTVPAVAQPVETRGSGGPVETAVAALYAGQAAQSDRGPRQESEPPPGSDAGASVPGASVAQAGSEGRQTREEPIDIGKMMRLARDELENERLREHPAPFINNLSQQTKDRIPTLLYQRHDYAGPGGNSSVVLGGQSLKTGERTSSGVKVEEILPDSVVLSFGGTQFRLRALNSWVNL